MRDWIRRWLGLETIEGKLNRTLSDCRDINANISRVRTDCNVHNRALGRIIAKLEPLFAVDELDPKRKAESDALGERVIAKLRGEVLASNHFGGEGYIEE